MPIILENTFKIKCDCCGEILKDYYENVVRCINLDEAGEEMQHAGWRMCDKSVLCGDCDAVKMDKVRQEKNIESLVNEIERTNTILHRVNERMRKITKEIGNGNKS